MTWPSDTLTNTNTDSPTDRPDLARSEINSAILMVKSILGEAPAGSLILTNQDEGTGNGLDADTVDGEHASAFANASHDHAAANITSGTLQVSRGGTGRTTHTQYSTLHGNGTGAISAIGPGTVDHVLTSNGPGAYATFQALPTPPTVDVAASDFVNGSVAIFPDSAAYDFNTGFGNDNFQWGISGLNLGHDGNVIVTGYQGTTKYQSYHHGDTDGVGPLAPNISGMSPGHIRFSIAGIGGTITAYIWARANL